MKSTGIIFDYRDYKSNYLNKARSNIYYFHEMTFRRHGLNKNYQQDGSMCINF